MSIATKTITQLLFISGLSLGSYTSTSAASLSQELTQAISNHPQVLAHQQRLQAADADIRVEKGNDLPTLDVSGDMGQQWYEDTGAGTDSDLSNNRFSLSLTQNLFKGFKGEAKKNEMTARQLTAQFTLEKTIQQLIYDGATTYLDNIHYQRLSELLEEKIVLTQRFIQVRQKQKDSGSGNQLNVYEAQLKLQRTLEQQMQFNNRQAAARIKYENVFNHPTNPVDMVVPVSITAYLPVSRADALSVAKQSNPHISIADSRLQQAQYVKEGVRGDYWPTVDLVSSYGTEENYQGVEGTKKDTRIYVKANWKYNLGNQISDKLDSASNKYHAEKYTLESTIRRIEQQVNQAWEKLQSAQQRNTLSEQTVEIAENIYRSHQEMKQKGRGSEAHLLNAQIMFLDARISQLNAVHETIKSHYDLAHACGILSVEILGGE